jgi:hypothetical protein
MTGFPDKLRLKEQADEDQFFARRDRELIAELHARRQAVPAHVVSGGQTGVDRAALDAALAAGLSIGGWCPAGRLAEDGVIQAGYPLRETPSDDPAVRTEWNIRDSDGTLILHRPPLVGGTALTAALAERLGKPLLVVDLGRADAADAVMDWLRSHNIQVLNVAGPRESESPGIGTETRRLLEGLLAREPSGSPSS